MKRVVPWYFEVHFIAACTMAFIGLVLGLSLLFLDNDDALRNGMLFGLFPVSSLFAIAMYRILRVIYIGENQIVVRKLFSKNNEVLIEYSNIRSAVYYNFLVRRKLVIEYMNDSEESKKIECELGLFKLRLIARKFQQYSIEIT